MPCSRKTITKSTTRDTTSSIEPKKVGTLYYLLVLLRANDTTLLIKMDSIHINNQLKETHLRSENTDMILHIERGR